MAKTAIITGCASGIGLATTQLFLSHNYHIFGIDVKVIDMNLLKDVGEGTFKFHQANLTKEGECDAAVAAAAEMFGKKIDVLANIAGVMDAFSSADTVTDTEWDRLIAINLTVPTKLMRAVLPFMKEAGGGAIVNVSSKAGFSGAAAGIAYTASKHGLIGASKNVAFRFREEGIRCNVVDPGGVATNMGTSLQMENFDQNGYNAWKPFWDIHNPDAHLNPARIAASDIANAIWFLADSESARMINGVVLPVDRAWSAA